ncbi:hypothetical protein D5086_017953 [Populus alba]|uniref:Uncharacterized protein n=1 Tax=Populus alba TaxID=43335 RepID=A0ACC4BNE3_POPAL
MPPIRSFGRYKHIWNKQMSNRRKCTGYMKARLLRKFAEKMESITESSATDLALSQPPLVSNGNQNILDKQVPAETNQPGTDQTNQQAPQGRPVDPNLDPKRLRRVLSNRVSAQKSRLKRLQYLADIERKVKALEEEIADLSPRVALYRSHHQALKMEQKMLNMEISAQTSNKMLKHAEIEENKAEVSRLRQLHLTQQEVMLAGWENGFDQQMAVNPSMLQLSLERMAFITSIQDGWRCVLGWDSSEQEMANPSLPQFGSSTVLNMNPQLGGIEQMMTFNSMPTNQELDKYN